MKLAIVLSGRGGELARREIIVDDDADASEAIANTIAHHIATEWILNPGDKIEIEEAA